jgi:hypothetical protein
MANKIKIKQSSVVAKVPLVGDLDQGELALNTVDEILYTKNSSGAIVALNTSSGLLDEDDFASDSNTQAPTQQSAKVFIEDTAIAMALILG